MEEPSTNAPRIGMQVVTRAATVLRALGDTPSGLSLSELAAACGMAKSTVHRLVAALEAEDFVTTAARGKIRLGRGIARLGAATRDQLRDQIRPHLVALHEQLMETVDVGVLDGGGVRLIDHISAPHRLLALSTTGARLPLHCTANGKALLAALPDDQMQALLPARLTPVTDSTITSRRAFWEEIGKVRAAGVAHDHEEYTPGICGVSAVVRDAYGPVAAISVPVPTQRFTGSERRVVEALLAACATCSAALGADLSAHPYAR